MMVKSREGCLLAISPHMVLGTNVVLFLCEQPGRAASIDRIVAALGASHEEVAGVVSLLARTGILEEPKPAADGLVRVARGGAALTLADMALATDDWLQVRRCPEDPGPNVPGLSQAMSLIREQVLLCLRQMSVQACLRKVRPRVPRLTGNS